MNTNGTTPYGFRIVGPTSGDRKLVDHGRAFAAYCAAEVPAGMGREGYLSAFTFDVGFRDHLHLTGATRGYAGVCGGDWLWFDLDRDADAGGIDAALGDTRALCGHLLHTFGLGDESLLVFYSGSKGFHVGLPVFAFGPPPGDTFHRIARRFAERVTADVRVVIDTSVYDRVRAFRAPNTRHPRTGRHKRRLTVDELLRLPAARIITLAGEPEAFDVPDYARYDADLPAAWDAATAEVTAQVEAEAQRRAAVRDGSVQSRLNRATFDFIRDGASTGDRHRLLFSAAANLAECGASEHLCAQLLTEAALDSGLPPREVERQIRCGVAHAVRGGGA